MTYFKELINDSESKEIIDVLSDTVIESVNKPRIQKMVWKASIKRHFQYLLKNTDLLSSIPKNLRPGFINGITNYTYDKWKSNN